MPFYVDAQPTSGEISEALNYLLANVNTSTVGNATTGQIVGSTGSVVGYLYKYLNVKYADSFDGTLNFSDVPANRLYYGLRNSDSFIESINPSDYVWTQVTGGFGLTKHIYYLLNGGRQIQLNIGIAPPSASWKIDPSSSIDLDLLTSTGGSGGGLVMMGLDGVDGDDGFAIAGPQGNAGASGSQGPAGPAVYLEADYQEAEMFLVPGTPGPAGASGSIGSIGPQGPIGFGMDGLDGEEGMAIPGPVGPIGATGATGSGGALAYVGAYHDLSTVTAISTTTIYVMNIGSIDIQNGTYIQNGTQLAVANAGIYNVQFSTQFSNPNAAIVNTSVWLRINGIDVTAGAGQVGIPAKHGSINALVISGWNYILTLNAGDYVELCWQSDSTGVQLITLPATTAPNVPVAPSLIITITQVMYTQLGPIGPQGLDGDQGEEGLMGIPGMAGVAGVAGAQGPIGPAVFLEADYQEAEMFLVQGNQGIQGTIGTTGSQGPVGPAVYLEAPEADEPLFHLGAIGPQGVAGTTGAQGPTGPAIYLEAPEAEEIMVYQGPQGNSGPTGMLAYSGALIANTTINATTTYTTGGATLLTQSSIAGQVWRVKAFGTFVAVTSATARNAQVAAFWGATQLVAVTAPVLISVAQTTNWELEFILTSSSTTAMWTAGYMNNNVASAASRVQSQATPASTAVTAGPQTLDLRFSMSVVVATDQWVVQSVTFERLK